MKKIVSILLITSLFISSFLMTSFAEAPQQIEKHYKLDTGVIFIWKNSAGKWQKGKPNEYFSSGYTLNLPRNAENVKVYPYDPSISFEKNAIERSITTYGKTQTEYDLNYLRKGSKEIQIKKINYNKDSGLLNVEYSALLSANKELFDVKNTLESPNGEQIIYDYMGTPTDEIKKALETLKPSKFSKDVEGYLFFVPTIVEYEIPLKPQILDDVALIYIFFTDTYNGNADKGSFLGGEFLKVELTEEMKQTGTIKLNFNEINADWRYNHLENGVYTIKEYNKNFKLNDLPEQELQLRDYPNFEWEKSFSKSKLENLEKSHWFAEAGFYVVDTNAAKEQYDWLYVDEAEAVTLTVTEQNYPYFFKKIYNVSAKITYKEPKMTIEKDLMNFYRTDRLDEFLDYFKKKGIKIKGL